MATLDTFRNVLHEAPNFFDEGPAVTALVVGINTGSISTFDIDGFRQGVEITRQKHYDAGLVKIWSGEPGHLSLKIDYGEDHNFRDDPPFEDLDRFDPVTFIRAQEAGSPLLLDILTWPIIVSDNDQIENNAFNGIIEPLSIRPKASFTSIDSPFEAHDVRGALIDGNIDIRLASDRVQTIYDFDVRQKSGFLDANYFLAEDSTVTPFVDARLVRNVTPVDSYSSLMTAALSLMSGSTDNYIDQGQRSAPAGYDYDSNASVGTDSLAFGGYTY